MTSDLRRQAQKAAGDRPAAEPDRGQQSTEPEPLPAIDYGESPGDWRTVTVIEAWNRVMRDVASIKKSNQYVAPGTRYAYRGYDLVVNAVGPALRRHGVMVIPQVVKTTHRDVMSSRNNKMRECTVEVTYIIYGPKGDSLPGGSAGEAMDTGDKGTTKAMTIAWRNFIIAALALPTEDPRLDAEARNDERGVEAIPPSPAEYRDELIDPRNPPSENRIQAIKGELGQFRLARTVVVDGTGEEVTLWELANKIGKELYGGGKPA